MKNIVQSSISFVYMYNYNIFLLYYNTKYSTFKMKIILIYIVIANIYTKMLWYIFFNEPKNFVEACII